MQVGMRLSEWCQDQVWFDQTNDVLQNIDGSPKAFIFQDFVFSDTANKRRNNQRSIHIKDATNVTIT